ncbi:MAG: pilin [Bacillota bacterium]
MRIFIYTLCLISSLFISFPVLAQGSGAQTDNGIGSGAQTIPPTAATDELTNPLKGVDTPQELIGSVIEKLFGIIGSLALVMFIYGGLIWMTSSGSSTQVKKGRDIIVWAIVGMVVIFSAYALVRFVIQGIGA